MSTNVRSNCEGNGSEFQRLLALPRHEPRPTIGDRVIIAGGLIGHGQPWVRLAADVTDVGEESVKVRLLKTDPDCEPYDAQWIHPALITDVFRQTADSQPTKEN